LQSPYTPYTAYFFQVTLHSSVMGFLSAL